MTRLKSFLRWLFVDTYPISLLPVILLLHMITFILYPNATATINKTLSNVLQFIGLIFVIKAINDNTRIIGRSSLLNLLSIWINANPLRTRRGNLTVQVGAAGELNMAGQVTPVLIRKRETLEEKLDFVFEEIKRLEREIGRTADKLTNRINGLQRSISDLDARYNKELEGIEGRLSDVFVGGAKEEVFGIACIFYSLIVSFFA